MLTRKFQNNDLKNHLSSQIRPKKLKSDQQEQQEQQQTKDLKQECSRLKICGPIIENEHLWVCKVNIL